MIVRRAFKKTKIVGGGGAIELQLSRFLKEYARTVAGKQQFVIERFAAALETIPENLALNCGADSITLLNKLRTMHAESTVDSRWGGIDCVNCSITNTFADFIWEPVIVKESALAAATEAACLILSIDDTIKNPKSEEPKAPPGMKGKGKGKRGKGRGKGMR